jgi:signal transduction histidine kinase
MTEQEMVRAIITEMRAAELATTLRHAIAGDAHWRREATQLLADIDGGILRPSSIEDDVCADADH